MRLLIFFAFLAKRRECQGREVTLLVVSAMAGLGPGGVSGWVHGTLLPLSTSKSEQILSATVVLGWLTHLLFFFYYFI